MLANFISFPKDDRHNPWLDLLRAFAIFFVLLRHGSRIEGNFLEDGVLHNIASNGWVGVDLFFVLSGFLITKSLVKNGGTRRLAWHGAYFKNRILRIVPAYYAVLFLCVAGFFPGFFPNTSNTQGSLFLHAIFLQDYSGSDINVVFWSLGVEEKFYLLAPLLVLVLSTAPVFARIGFAALLLCLAPLFRVIEFVSFEGVMSYDHFFRFLRSPFHMSMEGFIVGIVAALILMKERPWLCQAAKGGMLLGGLILLVLLGSHNFYAEIAFHDAFTQPLVIALIFGLITLCAGALHKSELIFEPFFRINSRLSYSLYLVHLPLIPLAVALSRNSNSFAFWLFYIGFSYAGAITLHFLVEKPFLKLKDRGTGLQNVHDHFEPAKAVRL